METKYDFLDEPREEDNEIMSKIILDTEEMKEIKTSESHPDLVCGREWITNKIINKYVNFSTLKDE